MYFYLISSRPSIRLPSKIRNLTFKIFYEIRIDKLSCDEKQCVMELYMPTSFCHFRCPSIKSGSTSGRIFQNINYIPKQVPNTNRLRFNCCGIFDILTFDDRIGIIQHQVQKINTARRFIKFWSVNNNFGLWCSKCSK
jgi:hypothetical protein